ncbi:MAG: Trm112 family protein [Pseudomonadota bacterium]
MSDVPQQGETPSVSPQLLESLVCPATGGRLTYDADRQELISKSANLAYPIRQGIPIMLIDEARTVED